MAVPQNLEKKRNHTCHHITSTMLLNFLNGESDRCMNWIMLLIHLLNYYNSLRNSHYLLCSAGVSPHEAPWRKLYEKADDLHMTGLNRHAFKCLLWYLFDDDEINSHRRRGRPRSLGADGYLGLLLFIWEVQCNTSICVLFLDWPQLFAEKQLIGCCGGQLGYWQIIRLQTSDSRTM